MVDTLDLKSNCFEQYEFKSRHQHCASLHNENLYFRVCGVMVAYVIWGHGEQFKSDTFYFYCGIKQRLAYQSHKLGVVSSNLTSALIIV